MSLVADIAEAVKDELNGHEFGMEFEATRGYLPLFDLAEMKDLHVTVVPKGMTMEMARRDAARHDVQLDVAVQKKLDAADNSEIDALMALVEEISDFLRFRRLEGLPGAAWLKVENAPVYSQEHLSEMRQITSVLTVTYRVMR
jgi:hypothetical protein